MTPQLEAWLKSFQDMYESGFRTPDDVRRLEKDTPKLFAIIRIQAEALETLNQHNFICLDEGCESQLLADEALAAVEKVVQS